MNLNLKHKLMLQSLSPLAFLTIVRNCSFMPVGELTANQTYWGEFVHLNKVLIVVFLLSAAWSLHFASAGNPDEVKRLHFLFVL